MAKYKRHSTPKHIKTPLCAASTVIIAVIVRHSKTE
jgi:hypothetical protein